MNGWMTTTFFGKYTKVYKINFIQVTTIIIIERLPYLYIKEMI